MKNPGYAYALKYHLEYFSTEFECGRLDLACFVRARIQVSALFRG